MEFTAQMGQAVARLWGLPVDPADAVRLHGGDESAVYRVGAYVIRVGAPWRSVDDLAWCGSVATAASRRVPEAVAPVPARDGGTVIPVAGRPVTVWPFVAGQWGEHGDAEQRRQVAELLARVHAALAGADLGPAPERSTPAGPVPECADAELDAWLDRFQRERPRQPVHGDIYAANVLVRDERVVALVDWDEATVEPPEWDVAGAAWEWSDGPADFDPARAMRFVDAYRTAGGPAAGLDEVALRQLIRARIRRETAYDRAVKPVPDAEDVAYQQERLAAFWALRPR